MNRKMAEILAMVAMFEGAVQMNKRPLPECYKGEMQMFRDPPAIPKGCKEYSVHGHKIVASNYKNACRKVNAKLNKS